MKIALAQQNYLIGDFEGNRRKILGAVDSARSAGADLVLFPELAVCGYPPRDFLEFRDFIIECEHSVEQIAREAKGIAILVGSPTLNPQPEGKDLFNSAYLLANGRIQQVVHKSLLPNYDVFDEYRYFEPNRQFQTSDFMGRRMALTVCEDIWNEGVNPLYITTPVDRLKSFHPDYLLNISASPFHYAKAHDRIHLLKGLAGEHKLPIFYCNCVGAQTELIFDGGSLVVSPSGQVFNEMAYFSEDLKVFDLDEVMNYTGADRVQPKVKISLMHDALVCGISEYFKKLGFPRAIIGLSGGIDSALVACLASRALGPENVYGLLMPSAYSSSSSVSDALALAANLGIAYDVIPITDVYGSALETLNPYFGGKPFDLTEENIQARIRSLFLMSLANKHRYILLNTSNKSEMAVGYGTLYGDMAGGISVLGDVYKTEVYEMARYINAQRPVIPESILVKEPSAELRPNQKDSDSLPEYHLLDPLLYEYIEHRKGPAELMEMGFDSGLVKRVVKLVNASEHKRHQAPPVLRVSAKAFGSGRRLPIVAKYLL